MTTTPTRTGHNADARHRLARAGTELAVWAAVLAGMLALIAVPTLIADTISGLIR